MTKEFTFEAIGTHFWIEISDEISDEQLAATKARSELLCSTFNQNYSRFRPDSQVSILNRERRLESPTEECRVLLQYGKELYLRSEGLFNPLVGHILEARGYDADYSFKAKDGADAPSLCNPLTDLMISKNEITLTCGSLDLGGYGKGYLIDHIAEDFLTHGIKHFLINGGGDMYGTSMRDGEAITIYLEHPTETSQYLMETTILNQGFAASSPFKRQWSDKERLYTHIIAESEVPKLATFVKANNALDADAFATVALLLPEERLSTLASAENLALARFNPASNQFWQTSNFN